MGHHEDTRMAIEEILTKVFSPISISVIDESAAHARHKEALLQPSAGHFFVAMKSALFDGKKAVERHRLVYKELQSLMDSRIHALRMDLKSSEE